jgi:predicted TIM-barrel fold metal-dependent hydrolase
MLSANPFFDAHLHVMDPRFPMAPNLHYLPAAFTAQDYLHTAGQLLSVAGFEPAGGVVVSGSFQGNDQGYLLAALAELGPRFVGVTMLAPDVPDAELKRLDAAGVRGIRLNLVRRVHSGDLTDQFELARRARALVGWHVELYIRSMDLPYLRPAGLVPPADSLVIDHLGITTAGLPALLALVAEGAHVKATGFSRGDLVIETVLRAVHQANPSALLAGTDLPGTRSPQAVSAADIDLLRRVFTPDELDRVAYRNAAELYRPTSS